MIKFCLGKPGFARRSITLASVLKLGGARRLDDRDRPALLALLARDPIVNCVVAARVEAGQIHSAGGEIWGYDTTSGLESACFFGANLMPIGSNPIAHYVFAERAKHQGRRCSSIVGPASVVAPLWAALAPLWGNARQVRPRQPLLSIDNAPAVAADRQVRQVTSDEIDLVLPASIAMFTEEVGVSPTAAGRGNDYRARVHDMIRRGRVFARLEAGQVIFKAEIGAISNAACQLQGVWVHPEWRGQGIGTAGTARIVEIALATMAPVVSLYVNDFNAAARAAYRRVGFRQVGTFMSVMF